MGRARVVVVGGGIAGLAAAYAIRRGAPAGTVVTVVEAAAGLGGKLRTSEFCGLPVDEGAETFLGRAAGGVELATAVGLGADLVAPETAHAAVVVAGTPYPLPAGTVLGVPADLAALRASGVLSPAGLAAVAAEAALPPEPVTEDVPVGGYVGRRFGREVVDRLVDPLLGGVYAGRADQLSLPATVPALARALTPPSPRAGSLLAAAADVQAAAAGGSGPVFVTVRGGLGRLVAAVARAADAEVRLGSTVRSIERVGAAFRLTVGPVPRPAYLTADAVVVAVPAGKAALLLAGVAPAAAAALRPVEYASVGIVTLGYPPAAVPGGRLPGSGLLVPAAEGRAVKAVTFSATKWAHLRPAAGPVVLRASVGRHGDTRVLHRDDADLAALVAAEVAELTGIAGRPVGTRVTRWGGGLPQYAVGHLDRVRQARAAVAAVPGLAVCGAAYDGVGIPACIRSGYAAAARVLDRLREWERGGRQARA